MPPCTRADSRQCQAHALGCSLPVFPHHKHLPCLAARGALCVGALGHGGRLDDLLPLLGPRLLRRHRPLLRIHHLVKPLPTAHTSMAHPSTASTRKRPKAHKSHALTSLQHDPLLWQDRDGPLRLPLFDVQAAARHGRPHAHAQDRLRPLGRLRAQGACRASVRCTTNTPRAHPRTAHSHFVPLASSSPVRACPRRCPAERSRSASARGT